MSIELYALLTLAFVLVSLFAGWSSNTAIFVVCVYFLAETLLVLLSSIFLQPNMPQPASYLRNFTMALVNYVQFISAFAVIYYKMPQDCFAGKLEKPLDALYFSLINASTVGFGEISPCTPGAKVLVILQILINFLFIYLIFGAFLQNVGQRTFMNRNKTNK